MGLYVSVCWAGGWVVHWNIVRIAWLVWWSSLQLGSLEDLSCADVSVTSEVPVPLANSTVTTWSNSFRYFLEFLVMSIYWFEVVTLGGVFAYKQICWFEISSIQFVPHQ